MFVSEFARRRGSNGGGFEEYGAIGEPLNVPPRETDPSGPVVETRFFASFLFAFEKK